MLGIWLPKHEVWTDEHHIKHHSDRQREKALHQEAQTDAEHKIPGIANHHVLHDHEVDHYLTFYPHPVHKRTIPRLIVYVQTFTTPDGKPLSLFPLLEHETGITHVILASVHLHEHPGEIRLNDNHFGEPVWDRIWEEVKVLQENGVKVMLMLGGAAAGTYRRLNGTEKEFYDYYYPLRDLIQRYNIDGLDLDIEEKVPLSVPIRLLTALHRDLGSSFILTMAPLASALAHKDGQNLSGFSYFDLDSFATVPGSDTKLVHWYNGMFYGGFERGPPFYQSVMEQGWESERVVMGVLDCADDGQPNGFVHVETLGETVRALRRDTRDSFGGVSGWEYWDAGQSEFEKIEPWMWVKKVGEALFEELPYEEENNGQKEREKEKSEL
ncbi:glycoside hydrolase superfamily [Leptodontidium sp. MPI-SDFR-AT-0119]|nr:glycoside hydrolase superfamily [Leptodontidium sp. MPI-SDFR-AT-0119]